VEGKADIKPAPDVLVIFGRPKTDRGSYRQGEEGNIPITVVIEILSPGNNSMEMDDQLAFYEEHGVEEYYHYDPEGNRLKIFLRRGDVLRRTRVVAGFSSPRLGIRFAFSGPGMVVYDPDGRRFLTFEELAAARGCGPTGNRRGSTYCSACGTRRKGPKRSGDRGRAGRARTARSRGLAWGWLTSERIPRAPAVLAPGRRAVTAPGRWQAGP
jgi:hypothetical protein